MNPELCSPLKLHARGPGLQAPHSPAAGRPGAAGAAAPAAAGSPRTAARSPSSAGEKVVGRPGPSRPKTPPRPRSPQHPTTAGNVASFPRTSKHPGGLGGTVRGQGTILWAGTGIRTLGPVGTSVNAPQRTAPTTPRQGTASRSPWNCGCCGSPARGDRGLERAESRGWHVAELQPPPRPCLRRSAPRECPAARPVPGRRSRGSGRASAACCACRGQTSRSASAGGSPRPAAAAPAFPGC